MALVLIAIVAAIYWVRTRSSLPHKINTTELADRFSSQFCGIKRGDTTEAVARRYPAASCGENRDQVFVCPGLPVSFSYDEKHVIYQASVNAAHIDALRKFLSANSLDLTAVELLSMNHAAATERLGLSPTFPAPEGEYYSSDRKTKLEIFFHDGDVDAIAISWGGPGTQFPTR